MPDHRTLAIFRRSLGAIALALLAAAPGARAQVAPAPAAPPAGEIKGRATEHDAASAAAVIERAQVAWPAALTGGAVFVGRWRDAPRPLSVPERGRVPVVVFLHGSSGLGLKAIEDWQRWLAGLGVASVAPDSFALPDRLTYTSPIDKPTYERIHALRASEITLAQKALAEAPWADPQRLLLAGTSEGAIAVARHDGSGFAGRMIFSWSCEDNYFVQSPATAATPGRPVLNVISRSDPYFSPSNPWLGNPRAEGHCAEALKGNPQALIVLLPQAPHTLINLPAARDVTAAFVRRVLHPE
jgi:dienelactone hydrolase